MVTRLNVVIYGVDLQLKLIAILCKYCRIVERKNE